MSKKIAYNPLTMYVCSHIPFRVPNFVNEHPEIYKVITNCDSPFPQMKTDLLRVDRMDCEYGKEQNRCLNEWRMINAVYNLKHIPEYVGICHYRRYFDPGVIERLDMRLMSHYDYDIVLGNPVKYDDVLHDEYDSFTFYGYWHNYKDFLVLEESIKTLYPEMSDAFDRMKKQEFLYNSAMMILPREEFIDLCDFVFSIYDDLMKRYGFKNDDDALKYVKEREDEYVRPYNKYYTAEVQSRLVGYLLERATNTWLQEKDEQGRTRIDKAAKIAWFMPKEEDIKL